MQGSSAAKGEDTRVAAGSVTVNHAVEMVRRSPAPLPWIISFWWQTQAFLSLSATPAPALSAAEQVV